MSESVQQSLIRLAGSRKGMLLFRNNVGALLDARGVPVRYGLANESKAMNQQVKSADLIGIEPIVITQEMVGQTIGRFVSIEVKDEDWNFSGKGRELAQMAWKELINSNGGRAFFATKPEDI